MHLLLAPGDATKAPLLPPLPAGICPTALGWLECFSTDAEKVCRMRLDELAQLLAKVRWDESWPMCPKHSGFQKLMCERTKNIFQILKTLYTQTPSLLIPHLPRCPHAVMWHSSYLYKDLLKLISCSSCNTSKTPASGFMGCTAGRKTYSPILF